MLRATRVVASEANGRGVEIVAAVPLPPETAPPQIPLGNRDSTRTCTREVWALYN